MFHLQLLGRFRLVSEPGQAIINVNRQSATFLGYFAIHRGRRIAEDAVIEQFWPDCDPRRGRSNLCSAIWRVRKAIGREGFSLIERSSFGETGLSDQAALQLDIEAFESTMMEALGQADGHAVPALGQGLEIYRGDLMPGWYDDWVLAERERLQGLYVGGLIRLMNHQAEQNLFDAGIATGRKILRIEPMRETVHRRLIELHLENGQPAAAHGQYHECVRLLRDELGVAPSRETQAAYARLQTMSAGAP